MTAAEDGLLEASRMQREAPALKSPGSIINDLLQGPNRITASVEFTQAAMIEHGANLMLANRWRITAAVYQFAPRIWPVEEIGVDGPQDRAPESVLADCRQKIAAEKGRGRAGHWTYDVNRHIALLQAERALTRIIEERG